MAIVDDDLLPRWRRYVARIPGTSGECLNVISQGENSEVTAHVSVSVWTVNGERRWLRLPTDFELNWVAQRFAGIEWEEDNAGEGKSARHLWAKSRTGRSAAPGIRH